jgi:hypothetical protein
MQPRQMSDTSRPVRPSLVYSIVDLYSIKLIGNSAYGASEISDWLVNDRGIDLHVPVLDKSKRTGTFSRMTSPTTIH